MSVTLTVVEGVVHVGARVDPAEVRNCPDAPIARRAVTPDPVWYGMDPLAPPAMFVALVAFPLNVPLNVDAVSNPVLGMYVRGVAVVSACSVTPLPDAETNNG